jgi:uncharacterized protein YndB with AHSA1/START domain
MAGKTHTFKFKRTVKAPPAEVYRAFTTSTALRTWLCDSAQMDARKGGRVYLWWNSGFYASGEFTTVAADKRLAFTWRGRNEPDASQVRVSLAADNGSTLVTVAHAGVGTGRAWAPVTKEIEEGWAGALENLQSVLETGQDLRFVRRPMLGVMIGEFNAEIARRLGVPVAEGLRLDEVVAGRGAEVAGLRKDDVIVGLGGMKVTSWPALASALQSRRAGDRVPVTFYRGGDRRTVTMDLSGRTLKEVPPTAAALAESVGRLHTQVDAALGRSFEGVSEEQAAYAPAPGEWSAKQTLAHLIAAERETQAWIADLINDDERWSDRFENPTSVAARLCATAAVFPSVPLLLEALKRSRTETVAMLASLPAEFVARQRNYWRLGHELLEQPEHYELHCHQIRAAIESARQP